MQYKGREKAAKVVEFVAKWLNLCLSTVLPSLLLLYNCCRVCNKQYLYTAKYAHGLKLSPHILTNPKHLDHAVNLAIRIFLTDVFDLRNKNTHFHFASELMAMAMKSPLSSDQAIDSHSMMVWSNHA